MNGISSQVATVDYLQLLTVQLKNQDPIDPVDQQGLVNDLTQFSILEGIEDLNTSFADILKLQEMTQGTSLLGKSVTYQDAISGEVKSGVATELFQVSGVTNLLVDGQPIDLQSVLGVANP
ncbi:flagellar hook assembly protein FlgD [Stieleria varia]|uniref:Basal-body rod modification protein FlgD n=1 Tax=Stieleria varia TaxID=2528005 RepID=A0A5C6AT28_9BACT|nr:flagellar hook capping FlgD N-terminal domain-containing protein [Stieleria varia]TWU02162.1 Basal-body rod modification protein FlgD [Stieleria varia]